MPSRRPAPPRRCTVPIDAAARVSLPCPARWPLALGISLLALAALCATASAAPLPPAKPKLPAGSPAAPAARGAVLRAAPLPPPRPPELAEEDAGSEERVAAPQDSPTDAGSADGFSIEPDRAPPPRMASRTAPDTAPAAVPLPPERPQPSGTPRRGAPAAVPAPAGGEAPDAAAPPQASSPPLAMPEVCADLVAEGEIEASLDVSVTPTPACGTFIPVRLTAVRLADGRMIPLKPAAISRCEMTVAAARWVREALAPAVATAGGALAAVRIADSYNCRPRNRVSGARMSEHGRGNAVDVGGFELGDGRIWVVAKGGLPNPLRASMKESACTRFTTVLGPGSDGYHEDHIHVDLAQRRNDFKLCRWNLDAGTAVAARKERPAPEAQPAPAGAAGRPQDGQPDGDEPGHSGRGEKSADAPADADDAAAPLPVPAPRAGRAVPDGKGKPANAGAPARPPTAPGKGQKPAEARTGTSQPGTPPPRTSQPGEGSAQGASSKPERVN